MREGCSEVYTGHESLLDRVLDFADAGGLYDGAAFDTGEARAALEGTRRLDSVFLREGEDGKVEGEATLRLGCGFGEADARTRAAGGQALIPWLGRHPLRR